MTWKCVGIVHPYKLGQQGFKDFQDVLHMCVPVLTLAWLSWLQVRWADLEAKKEEQRRRDVGFCIGGQWGQVTEEEAQTILMGGKTEEGQTDNT